MVQIYRKKIPATLYRGCRGLLFQNQIMAGTKIEIPATLQKLEQK